jgi:hypothetical protein
MSGKASRVPKAKKGGVKGKKGVKPQKKWSKDSLMRGKKLAWARCFEAENNEHRALRMLCEMRKNPKCEKHIPKHIADQYTKLVAAYDKTTRECPICTEDISFETSELTDCGHLFHKKCLLECFEKDPRCPVCRDKYKPKASPQTTSTSVDPAAIPKVELSAPMDAQKADQPAPAVEPNVDHPTPIVEQKVGVVLGVVVV